MGCDAFPPAVAIGAGGQNHDEVELALAFPLVPLPGAVAFAPWPIGVTVMFGVLVSIMLVVSLKKATGKPKVLFCALASTPSGSVPLALTLVEEAGQVWLNHASKSRALPRGMRVSHGAPRCTSETAAYMQSLHRFEAGKEERVERASAL